MSKVKILIEGFTSADTKSLAEEKTCATISLVHDKDIVMVVDPGVLDSQEQLILALEKEGFKKEDVTHVFITHSHIDHYRNIGMFANAKTVEYYGIWSGGSVNDWQKDFAKDIKIIKTPGHSYDGLSLLVETEIGKVAIVGDVFWKESGPEKDPYASDEIKLRESRQKILDLADYVIPGHGPMFKVNK